MVRAKNVREADRAARVSHQASGPMPLRHRISQSLIQLQAVVVTHMKSSLTSPTTAGGIHQEGVSVYDIAIVASPNPCGALSRRPARR